MMYHNITLKSRSNCFNLFMTIKKILLRLQKKKIYNKGKLILVMREKNLTLFKILKKLKLLQFNKIEFLLINFTVKLLKNTMILSLNQVQ